MTKKFEFVLKENLPKVETKFLMHVKEKNTFELLHIDLAEPKEPTKKKKKKKKKKFFFFSHKIYQKYNTINLLQKLSQH